VFYEVYGKESTVVDWSSLDFDKHDRGFDLGDRGFDLGDRGWANANQELFYVRL
jgi:hypothetical protein